MNKYGIQNSMEKNPVWKDKKYLEIFQKRYQLTDELIQHVKEGNEYQALNILEKRNHLDQPGALKNETEEYKYDVLQLESVIMYVMHGEQVVDTFLDEIHTEFIQKMERAAHIHECRKAAREMVSKYCGLRRYRTLCSSSVLVQKILVTVDMDLKEPLTLQYFAEKLSVNSSYLSNLFRTETGTTITEYVTQRRMQHASGLLQTTQYPVRMVAELVGIPDVHYFSKLFKRHMGETPSLYREKRGSSLSDRDILPVSDVPIL